MSFNKYFYLSLVALMLQVNSLAADARAADFVPLAGLWQFDQTVNIPGSPNAKCSIVFPHRNFDSEDEFDLIDSVEDFFTPLKGKASMLFICFNDAFLGDKLQKVSDAVLGFTKKYPANSAPTFTNRAKVKSANLQGASRIGFSVNIDEANDKLSGAVFYEIDSVPAPDIIFTATRKKFPKRSKLKLNNSIKRDGKGKLVVGDIATFIATVRSFGNSAMADDETAIFIQLSDEISASSITLLPSEDSGSRAISDCSQVVDPQNPAQIQCKLKALGPDNALAKLVFKVSMPDTLEGKDLDIVVDSGLVSPSDDKFSRIKVNSRPARFNSGLESAPRGKIACVIKGTSPLKKTSAFLDEGAIASSLELDKNPRRFIFVINGNEGKSSTVFGLSGSMPALPDLSTLLLGETQSFTSNDTRLNTVKSSLGKGFVVTKGELNIGGLVGAGPFDGLIKITGTSTSDRGKTLTSGQFQINMSGGTLTKTKGTKTSDKTVGSTIVKCKFRDLLSD